MTNSTQIANTEIFAFITVIEPQILFINKKDNKNCLKVGFLLRKQQISLVNY